MKKLKPNIVLLITSFLLIIGGLFIKGSFFTYEKCFESEKEKIDEYFTYIGDSAAQHAAIVYEEMLSEARAKADLISQGIDSGAELEDIFNMRYLSSRAEAGLLLSAEGFFEYGQEEYRENFGYTAALTAQTGETRVSKIVLCNDGQRRFAVAVPLETGGAVLLVFPISSITELVDSELLGGFGRILLKDAVGNPVPNSKLTEYINGAGKKLYIRTNPVGESGWITVCYVSDSYIRSSIAPLFSIVFGAYILSFALILIFGLISVFIISLKRKRLYIARKRFDIVTRQSARVAYQLDRKSNRISIISESEKIRFPDGLEEMPVEMFLELVYPEDRKKLRCGLDEFEKNGTASASVRIAKIGGSPDYRWYNIDAALLTQIRHGAELVVGSVEDIDERERERLMLRKKATTDPLTGLFDRAETRRIINERLANLGENEHSIFCIIDLDNFKLINDLFGHDCGDRALLFFSEKLKSTFRYGDIIGRLGGDEFIVYIPHTADGKIAKRRFSELMESLSKSKLMPELPEISCSVGYVTARGKDSFESLYKRADEAMYKAKTAGKKQAVGE